MTGTRLNQKCYQSPASSASPHNFHPKEESKQFYAKKCASTQLKHHIQLRPSNTTMYIVILLLPC